MGEDKQEPQEEQEPVQGMPVMNFGPVPQQYQVDLINMNGQDLVRIIISSRTHVSVSIIPPKNALEIASNIRQAASQARPDIVVARAMPEPADKDVLRKLRDAVRADGG